MRISSAHRSSGGGTIQPPMRTGDSSMEHGEKLEGGEGIRSSQATLPPFGP